MGVVVKYNNKFIPLNHNKDITTLEVNKHKQHTDIQIIESDDIATTGLSYTEVAGGYQCNGGKNSGELVIPSIYNKNKVISIGANAFKQTYLTTVILGDNITTIGDYAFAYSDANFILGDNITTVGAYAFYSCDNLTDSYILKNVTTIGEYAFAGCGLTSVTILDGITTIPKRAFDGCNSLKSVTIPDSVTTIGEYAFAYGANGKIITFKGTMAQWNAIGKGLSWSNGSVSRVICTDGTIWY